MSLIYKQDALKALRDTFLGDTYEIDEVACKAIESLQPVEAIPISWLQEWPDKVDLNNDLYEHSDYVEYIITCLLIDWENDNHE